MFIISLVISIIGIAGSLVFQLIIDNFGISTGYYSVVEEEHDHEHSEEGHDHDHSHEGDEPIEAFLEEVAELVEHSNFSIVFLALIGLYLLSAVIQYLRGYLIVTVAKKIDIRLVLSYYNHIMDLPVKDVMNRLTGEYLSRFSDASAIRDAISGATLTLLLDTLMVVAAGVILCLENSTMFLVSVIIIVLYAIIVLCFRKPIETANRTVMEDDAVLQSYFKESIDGVETIKAACAEQDVKNNTTSKFSKFINSVVKANMISISQNTLSDAAQLIGTAVILWIGFSLVLSQQITIGALMSFYALMSYFTTPVKNLIELQPKIQTAFVAADRLDDILEQEIEKIDSSVTDMPKINRWELKNIDFRYGNRELVLQDVSISMQRGQKIALVGESGSGKTTIAKLLLNFYTPEKGNIEVGGQPIEKIGIRALRSSIAYVDQNTFLFADTIKNNLKLGNPDVTDDEIINACKLANADEYISALPLGYDTPIYENGSDLSGGQRQRLAIARAILRKPQLLILDEATSNLDTITENAIKNTIFNLSDDISCVIIAHRLSTIRNCDKIYVMDNGKVIEEGSHDELIDKQGTYYKMWTSSQL
ncbi:peptidase domain-containing ABC transporter [Ruminococcus sp.]|uniref:peptidase domain-containing ABC transporter n=1 Tax=Ruminococcus sp. TaxID=41978 RepID=UPI0025DC5F54|nr:peptidase domain-containing ABC transporter [Ruminococcus sp.]